MNEQKFEAILRRIMREEIEQAHARLLLQSPNSTRLELLEDMKGELRVFFAQELGVQIAEVTVRRLAAIIAGDVINHFTEFCNLALLPTIGKKVQEAVDPYFRYLDQKLQEYEGESDWWKQNADESNDREGESTQPGKERRNRGEMRTLDHEQIRDMFRDEVHRTLRVIVREVWIELYGRWGLGSDAFKEDLEPLHADSEESRALEDDRPDIPF